MTRHSTLLLALLVFSLSGCPSATTQPGNDAATGGDTGAGSDAGAGTDATASSDAGTSVVDSGAACDYVDGLDRTCSVDTDCAVGLHQTDCCGSSVMIGYRGTQTTVPAMESACMASYPACGCAAMLPTTDSGETVTDTSLVQVACVTVGPTAVCRTYVTMRPPNGR